MADVRDISETVRDSQVEQLEANVSRLSLGSQATLRQSSDLEITSKCLFVAKGLLERIQVNLRENETLYGLLDDLILPSLKSPVPAICDTAVICLGLFGMLDKSLAQTHIALLLKRLEVTDAKGTEDVAKLLFDLLVLYGMTLLKVGA